MRSSGESGTLVAKFQPALSYVATIECQVILWATRGANLCAIGKFATVDRAGLGAQRGNITAGSSDDTRTVCGAKPYAAPRFCGGPTAEKLATWY